MFPRPSIPVLLLLALAWGPAPDVHGQSVVDRTPDISDGWVSGPGETHFHFTHRFNAVDAGDETVVVNSPTFFLAAPLPAATLVGVRYASQSRVTPGENNEWELLARWAPLVSAEDAPVDLSLTGAYNTAATSVDGEAVVGLPLGRIELLGVGRFFSDPADRGEAGWAGGVGAILRLTDSVALSGDVISASDLPASRTTAWGAGLQLQIPFTPHSLSLQAGNTRTTTLQGSTEGVKEDGDSHILWGFEFTIPITWSRYF